MLQLIRLTCKRFVVALLATLCLSLTAFSQTETLSSGAFIINMGATNPQTIGNGLKPYGLIYDMLRNYKVPVKWVISQSKAKDGADFTYNGVQYKGGTFIIPSEYRTTAVNSRITYWTGLGVVGATTTSALTVDVTYTLRTAPKFTLDAQNGAIAEGFLTNAGITNTNFPGAYNWKLPANLDCCDDYLVMPHADPTWATHGRLFSWNKDCLGSIWTGCHAGSALCNMVNPANRTQQTNFLVGKDPAFTGTTGNYANSNSLILWNAHSGGSVPYTHRLPSDPIAQYMGITDGAQLNGSEQIFIPRQGNALTKWNAGAKIIAYDPTQADVPSVAGDLSNAAAVIVYGRAFDDPNRGYVMYEAAHSINKGTSNDVAAQRAFFNFSFFQCLPKVPQLSSINGIADGQLIKGGTAVALSIIANSPMSGVSYTYQWTSSYAGTFSNPTGASTNFTPNVPLSNTPCKITCTVTDNCGRQSFQTLVVIVTQPQLPPVLTPDAASISVTCGLGTSVTTNVLSNDSDPASLPLTLTSVTGASNGTLSYTSGGNVTFTPNANFTGPMVLNYTACNNATPTALCSNSTYTISISGASTPSTGNDAYTIAEDNIGRFNVLSNDAVGLTVIGIPSPPANGRTSINTDNTITYVPNPNFAGTDNFTYMVSNTSGGKAQATVTVTVTNDACDGTPGAETYETTPATPGSLSGNPTNDTYLSEQNTGRNYGTCATFIVDGQNGARAYRGLMKFDLSSIPSNAVINSATLTLVSTAVQSNNSFAINVHRMTRDWSEGAQCNTNGVPNWNQYSAGNNWTTVGGDYDATVSATTNVSTTGTYTWNLATLVQNWVNGTNSNYGMLFKFTNENTANEQKTFGATENTTSGNRPVLAISYTIPAICSPIPTRAPQATPDTANTPNGVAVNINTATNDYYPVSGARTYSIVTAPASGSATINGTTGVITYTPATTFNGVRSIVYRVLHNASGLADTSIAYVNITNGAVTASNDNPAGALSGVAQTITVKSNDSDPDIAALDNTYTVSIATQPANGSATVNGSGQVIYTPNNGFTGTDSLFYQVCEPSPTCGSATCSTAKVTLTVNNQPPVANPDSKTILVCAPGTINLITNDTDPENGVLTVTNISALSNPAAGVLVNNNDGTVTFTPATGYTGTVTFTYTVTDDGVTPLTSVATTVTINVVNLFINNPPVALDDAETMNMDETDYASVRDNDSDPDGNQLTIPVITVAPLHGTATVLANGLVVYTPNPGYYGTDVLTYQVCDIINNPVTCATSTGLCTTANVTYTIVSPNIVYAVNDENSTWINTPVSGGTLANDFDPEGDNPISFTGFYIGGVSYTSGSQVVSGTDASGSTVANAGTLSINSDGRYTFTPANNFTGYINVPYTIIDANPNTAYDTAYLLINVTPLPAVGNSVIANNDEDRVLAGTTVNNTLFANDWDPQGNSFTVTAYQYDPNGDGTTIVSGTIGSPVTVGGTTTSGMPVSNAGTLTINANGSYTFVPATDFTGSIDLPYTICDNVTPQACATARLHITVMPDLNGALNDAPQPGDDFAYTKVNTSVTASFFTNDSDPNGDQLSLNGTTINTGGAATPIGSAIATAQGGTVQFYANGTYKYTPPVGFTGPDSVGYQVCDITAVNPQPLCTNAFLHLLVGANNSTNAINDENSTWQDVNVSGNVMNNDFDAEKDVQTFGSFLLQDASGDFSSGGTLSGVDKTGAAVANAGVLTFDASGNYTFDPAPSFLGTVTIPYRLCDSGNPTKCDTAYLTITVDPLPTTGINTVIANNDENISYGDPVSGSLFVNDRDPQRDAFTVTSYGGGALNTPVTIPGVNIYGTPVANAGTLTVNTDGSYTYTPAVGFYGYIDVAYTITDTPGATSTAILHIDVVKDPNGPLNDPPFAGDDFGYTTVNVPVSGSFISNDSDPNGDPVSLNGTTIVTAGPHNPIGTPVATAQGGTVQFYTDGTYTYTPPTNYVGPDYVNYTICDVTVINPQPLCATAMIHLLVGPAINLSGKVWDDSNGDVTFQSLAEQVTNVGGTLYVNLGDDNGKVVATAQVQNDGTYSFSSITPGVNYSLVLSTTQGTVGQNLPAAVLPSGWVATGENRDGTIDGGSLSVIDKRNIGYTSTINYDFGIERLPNSNNQTYTIAPPAVNSYLTLNGSGVVNSPAALAGSDPEDGTLGATHTMIITTVPNNAALYYDFGAGPVLVTNNTTITNYDPSKLQVKFTTPFVVTIIFNYATVDAAGKQDPTPAVYTINLSAPLPVRSIDVTASVTGTNAVIKWVTQNEINTSSFTVERSTDFVNFSSVGTVAAAGNNAGESKYMLADNIAGLGNLVYYRIKVVDADGHVSYSKIVTVRLAGPKDVKVWPTPFTDLLNVTVYANNSGAAQLELLDNTGKKVFSTTYTMMKGNNQFIVEGIARLARGAYWMKMVDKQGETIIMKQVTKQ